MSGLGRVCATSAITGLKNSYISYEYRFYLEIKLVYGMYLRYYIDRNHSELPIISDSFSRLAAGVIQYHLSRIYRVHQRLFVVTGYRLCEWFPGLEAPTCPV